MNSNPTTLSVDEQIDKLVISLIADGTNTWMPPYYDDLSERIKSLIKEVCEEVIGQNETIPQSETGIDLGMITGKKPRNDLRDEQRTKLNKIMGEK